jgi:hypothetical protein
MWACSHVEGNGYPPDCCSSKELKPSATSMLWLKKERTKSACKGRGGVKSACIVQLVITFLSD